MPRRGLLSSLGAVVLAVEHREVHHDSRWNDPSFFNSFQSGESTCDYDGEQIDRDPAHPFHDYVDGYQPSITDPFDPKEVAPEWFATLSSAGAEQAYQTLPEPKNGPYGHAQATGTWYRNAAGNFIDSYVYPTHYAEQAELQKTTGGDLLHLLKGSAKKQANWFDASVSQYDAYGRPKSPYPGNPAMLLHDGYRQQAVNSTLACQSGGCNATAELSFSQEGDLQNCKLSVKVKPTDFGVNKVVEFITVNDHTVSLNCQPPSSDCSEADKLTSLFDCVFEIDVQHLLSNRSLQLSAKISDGVNKSDCAYKGNLLYAVPQVTCLVGPVPGVAMNISDVLARPVATPIKLNQKLKSRKAASRHLRVKQQ